MALEYECDFFLARIYTLQNSSVMLLVSRTQLRRIPEIQSDINESLLASIDIVLPILITDNHIERVGRDEYRITDKGIAFLNTDTYTERLKRWNIENHTKSFQYKMRYVPYIFSALAVVLSLYSILTAHNKVQSQKLTEQELRLINSMQNSLMVQDSLLKIKHKQ